MMFKIVKKEGGKLVKNENVSPVNLFPHAMFSQFDVYLNEELVTKNNGLYPYKAYMGTTCSYSQVAKESWLESELYYQDSPGDAFDSYVTKPTSNGGLVMRHELCAESRVIDTVFRPHSDLFNQPRPIPPNVNKCKNN